MNHKKYNLIGIIGKKGSGKDTAANYIIQKNPTYLKYSFADPLKKVCSILFNFTEDQLYGDKKEEIDKNWDITPRKIMQYIGTDILRDNLKNIIPHYKGNIWITLFEKQLEKYNNLIVPDVRFNDEAYAIKKNGGILIKIERDLIEDEHSSHISENTIFDEHIIDYTIVNNSSLVDLYDNLDLLFQE